MKLNSTRKRTDLSMCFWNIGGLYSHGDYKLDDDLFLKQLTQHDIIFLAETHVSKNHTASLTGYHYFPVCREISSNGNVYGGLAVISKLDIKPHISILPNKHTEIQWIVLDKNFFHLKNDLYICVTYISPGQTGYSQTLNEDILHLLESDIENYKQKGDLMICGDFNARTGNLDDFISNDGANHLPIYDYRPDTVIKHRYSKDSVVDRRGKDLVDLCIGTQMRLLNGRLFGDNSGQYTCFSHNGQSVVDYCMVSEKFIDQVLFFKVSPFMSTCSDKHCKISWNIISYFNCQIQDEKNVKCVPSTFKWCGNSSQLYQAAFLSADIQNMVKNYLDASITNTNIDTATDELNKIYIEAAKKSLYKPALKDYNSSKTKPKSKNKKWFNRDLHQMRKRVICFGRKLSSSPFDLTIRNRYFRLYREYNKCRKQTKRQYKQTILQELQTLHDTNPKSYWKLISNLRDEDSCSDTNNNISLDSWLKHFQSLNSLENKFSNRDQFLQDCVKNLEKEKVFNELDNSITQQEILAAISKLKNNKSPYLDLISNEMIKSSQHAMIHCLSKLFNSCLTNSFYPKCWSEGYIVPIHKSGDPNDPSNYRGITITSTVGKLFNTILNERLDKYLIKNSVIHPSQIGFTKKARTSDHIFVLNSLINKYCNKKAGRLYTCFIDLRKAFDSVIHSGLKFKLLSINLGSNFYKTIVDMYIKSRSSIKLGKRLSSEFSLSLGVRQGDNLSPNLFNIFMNDLPNYLESTKDPVLLNNLELHCLLYADDLVLLSTSPEGLQSKLDCLEKYCNDWCLNVNINKTKILTFNKSGKLIKHNFYLGGELLDCVNKYKYLGILFSASGSFSDARKDLYNKSLKAYFKLCKMIFSFHPHTKTSMHIFDHTVKPIMLYASEVWGAFNTSSSKFRNGISLEKIYDKLEQENLHSKFCKRLLGVHKKSTNFAVFSELGRIPYYVNIIVSMLKYWHHLEQLPNDSLLFNALKESKDAHFANRNTWYSSIDQLCSILDIDKNHALLLSETSFKKYVKSLCEDAYINTWYKDRNNNSVGKLDTYCKIKTSFRCEKYLTILSNPQYRRHICRLRISAHRLKIETGRYSANRLERNKRICKMCESNCIEDETHFLIDCSAYTNDRIKFFNIIDKTNQHFSLLSSFDKLFWILNCETTEILLELGNFLCKHLR